MLPKEKIELVRQGECRHEIIDRQSFRKAFLYPLRNFMPTAFRTVTVAAGLVTDFLMSAIRAGAENAAPHGRGATFFNVKNGADHLRRYMPSEPHGEGDIAVELWKKLEPGEK